MVKPHTVIYALTGILLFLFLYEFWRLNTCALIHPSGCGFRWGMYFDREAWLRYPIDNSNSKIINSEDNLKLYIETICKREMMVCDLTQNIIPIGTPYENVLQILGTPSSSFGINYNNLKTNVDALELLSIQKKLLIYKSGQSTKGENYLLIYFDQNKINKFDRGLSGI
jgi:hypothetical protein